MSLIQKLAGETAIYGIPTILSRVLNFAIIAAYLTSQLSVENFGNMQLMYVFAATAMVVFTYRMETTLFRFGSKKETTLNAFTTAASAIIGTTVILAIVIIIIAEPLSFLILETEGLHRYFYYFAAIISLDALAAIPFAKLRLDNQARRFSLLKVINILANVFFILFFLEGLPWLSLNTELGIQFDETNKLDYVFFANLLASSLVFILVIPVYSSVAKSWAIDTALLRKMMHYTWPLAVIAFAGVINQQYQFQILQWVLPEDLAKESVGVYGAASKLAIFMTLFTTAFNYAAEPFFFKHAEAKTDRNVFGNVAFAYTIVAVFVFLGVSYYLDVVQWILPQKYHAGVAAVPILLMAFLFLGLYYNVAIWYKLADRTQIGMYISVGGAFVTIVLNILLIPILGYFGSAWSTLLCYVIMVVVCYILCQKYYPIQYPVGKILFYLVVAVIFWWISDQGRSLLDDHLPYILIFNTFLLFVFAGLIYFKDRRYIRQILA
ncbi:MAG: polysaccharide biosynthesis C-terminal domain-containing protein [Bacteroidia bacterium]|nr:polysaccharide biosynthesis C-terminal domain-containing protein [Bacteroidia bacterium]